MRTRPFSRDLCHALIHPDNEYAANTDEYYMEAIKEQFLKDGLDVPTIFNDPNTGAHFAKGIGAPDIYGWDRYIA